MERFANLPFSFRIDWVVKCGLNETISLIVPIYNTNHKLLRRAVTSALEQDYLKEVLLIDDGSRSETADFVDLLADEYPDLVISVHKENGGASSARNKGLDMAMGEYVAFLDSDDVLMPGFCSEALSIAKEHNADVVFGAMEYVFLSGKSRFYGNVELGSGTRDLTGSQIECVKGCLFNSGALMKAGLKPAQYVSQCSALYKRSTIGDSRFVEGIKISEDRLFNFDVLDASEIVSITGRCWYRYIQNPASASQSLRLESMHELLETARAFEELKVRDGQLAGDIDTGIVECFQQTLYFSILHDSFSESFGMSRKNYVVKILEQPIYREAFANADGLGVKQKLLKVLFQRRMPGAIVAMFRANKLLFDVKKKLIRNKAEKDREEE